MSNSKKRNYSNSKRESNSNSNSNNNTNKNNEELSFFEKYGHIPPINISSTKHMTFEQIKGIIKVFKSYFELKDRNGEKRRLTKQLRESQWQKYKTQILFEYGRVIKGKLESEKAYIKRHTDPLAFIKYRLRRSKNLNYTGLSPEAQEYYFEIGGTTDVTELYKSTENVDSVRKASRIAKQPANKRRRLSDAELLTFSGPDGGPSVIASTIPCAEPSQAMVGIVLEENSLWDEGGLPLSPNIVIPKPGDQLPLPHLSPTKTHCLDHALQRLKNKLDTFELEQLDKKKIEMYEVTTQKTRAIIQEVSNSVGGEPQLIGVMMPGISLLEQSDISFEMWLHQNIECVKDKLKNNVDELFEKVCLSRQDSIGWEDFLQKWKLKRVLYSDEFECVWEWCKKELDLEVVESITENVPELSIELNTNIIEDPTLSDEENQ